MRQIERAAEEAWKKEMLQPQMTAISIGPEKEYTNKADWLQYKKEEWKKH